MTIEQEIMEIVRSRLKLGEETYGKFKEDDSRDWEEETLDELIDGLIYLSVALIRKMRKQ